MTLSPQWLDELRARTVLSTLIGQSVKISKAGREYRGCCPFHNEKTPSFYVNDDKGFYHCFGCSAHGDAIRWMTDHRGLPFIDAVKELAAAAGMTLPPLDPRAAERNEASSALYDVMAAAQTWFAAQLHDGAGADALAYLGKRGINRDSIARFGLGYAPDGRQRLAQALSRFTPEKLIEAGLLISVDEKPPYDRFRERLMIPIRDVRGRVIAFGGRIIGSGEPKYLNSPDTPLFDKGRTLYNIDQAGAASRKTGRIIVVEGYLDALALAQAGIDDVVAPLGTALTEHQIARLWRLCDVPIICLDGDSAGRKAALRAALRALPGLTPGKSLRFANLPSGQDPDDIIQTRGAAAFEAIIAQAEPLVDRLWQHEHDALPLDTPEARAGFRQRLDAHVSTIADEAVRQLYRDELRARFSALFDRSRAPRGAFVPRRPVGATGRRALPPALFERPVSGSARMISGEGVDSIYARAVMAGLLRYPGEIAARIDAISLIAITDPPVDALRRVLIDSAFAGEALDSDSMLTICEQAGCGATARSLLGVNGLAFSFTARQADESVARRDLGMAIEALAARPGLIAALAAATQSLGLGGDAALFAEQQRLARARAEADARLALLASGDAD